MISKWHWLILQLTRTLWIRVALFCLLAIVTALVAVGIDPLIPASLSSDIGADAVGNILNILASSMLAVTTFSLSVMVSAYSAATSNVTPRATTLLMQDTTTQNVLATFIGSFVYALVGIITLSTGAYGESGLVALYLVTVGVIVLIVATILRWIGHLSRLGRVKDTTDKVEAAARTALDRRLENPYLGARPLRDEAREIPAGAQPVFTANVGYLQHVDIGHLSELVGEGQGRVFVTVLPGEFIHPARPLARFDGIEAEEAAERIAKAFSIGNERSFDQDPRFGLLVLAEIASRALSPAVNDPGTAIDVIGRAVRLFLAWGQPGDEAQEAAKDGDGEEVRYPRVWVRPLSLDDMFDDIFVPLARDGAGMVEIQVRLQKAFAALHDSGNREMKDSALRFSKLVLARAEAGLVLEPEKQRVRALADAIGKPAHLLSVKPG